MKKLIALLLLVGSLLIVGCNKEEPADMTPPKGADVASPGSTGAGGGGNTTTTAPSSQ